MTNFTAVYLRATAKRCSWLGFHTLQYYKVMYRIFSLCVPPPRSCPEGSVHHTVAEVMRFVEERITGEDGKDSRSLRGPYLARLELMHRLRERGCPEERLLGKNTALCPPPPSRPALCTAASASVCLALNR